MDKTQDETKNKGKGTGMAYSKENGKDKQAGSDQDLRKGFEEGQQNNDMGDTRNKPGVSKEDEPVEENSENVKPDANIKAKDEDAGRTKKKMPEINP